MLTRSNRLNTLESAIAKLNSIFSQTSTTCNIVDIRDVQNQGSGAYTNMETFEVVLPALFQEDNTTVDSQAIWGADYHELAHILFSAIIPSLNRIYGDTYIIAEENRVENLFNTMIPGNKKTLGYGVCKATHNFNDMAHSVNTMTKDELLWNYYLIALRPWVGDTWSIVRNAAVDQYGEKLINKIDTLLLEYCAISKKNLNGHQSRKILIQLHDILPQKADHPQPCQHSFSQGHSDIEDDEVVQKFSDSIGNNNAQTVKSHDSDGSDGEQIATGGISGNDDETATPIIPEKKFAEHDQKATKEMGKGSGSQSRYSQCKFDTIPVGTEEKQAKKALARELEKIQDSHAPGYEHNMNHGSVVIDRIIQPNPDFNTMFKKWNPGVQQGINITVGILVDISGSMTGKEPEMMKKIWPIISAIESSAEESHIAVTAFDTDSYPVYQPHQKLSSVQIEIPQAQGGTNPWKSLKEMDVMFNQSQHELKMLLVFTDGGWYGNGNNSYKDILEKISQNNVSTGIFSYGLENSNSELFDYSISSNNMNNFRAMGKTMVMNLMDKVYK